MNNIKENIHNYDDTQYATEENLKLQIDLMKLENKNLQLQIEKLSQHKEISVDYERIEQIVRKVVQENRQQSDSFKQRISPFVFHLDNGMFTYT